MAKKKDILQRIMFHTTFGDEKMFMESRDGVSIPLIWNNITGKNFGKNKKGHEFYLLRMKHEAGLPSGYLQFYPDYSNKEKYEKYCVPASTDLDVHKLEIVNRGGRIMNAVAKEFSDLFEPTTDKKEAKYLYGLGSIGQFKPTESCSEAIKNWHCTQWGHTSYFEFHKRENGITDIYIKADQIIASSLFACIKTNSLPAPIIEKDEESEESNVAIATKKDTVVAKMTAMDVLKKCTLDGRVIRLPKMKLDKELYDEVKNILYKNGAEWKGHRIQGFLFQFDPKEIFERFQSGEKVNLKQEYQFFETQINLARTMVMEAGITKVPPSFKILEPSAGQGGVLRAIAEVLPSMSIDICEVMPENIEVIKQRGYRVNFICEDFLQIPKALTGFYDRIIANPPFSNNQDIEHCMKMYECLKKGGRMVTILGTSWMHGKQKKQEAFRKWLKEVDATIENIAAGAFSQSGTTVKTVLCIINKH